MHTVTYAQVGASVEGVLPPGYQHDRASVGIGRGADAFDQGRSALRHWAAHAHIGATLFPSDAPLQSGGTVVVTIPVGPFVVVAPCRIVSVVDTDDAFGFAYGTLPGHPEKGEESFMVRRDCDGDVTLEIVAFSRPRELLVRIGWPLSRLIQRRATKGYLEGVRRFVLGDESRR